ncbi:hypothetical protein [Niallia sp. 03133]|uniref:hypothetical protein n=1 Tax=Niallia sp. 03133 TaxID=3458060 RepID=UPI0040449E05
MNIVIDLEYWTKENIGKQKAIFGVDELQFKINPDKEALRVAYNWFDKVRQEYPHDIKINSVKYNGEHDITQGMQNVLKKVKRIAFEEWKAPHLGLFSLFAWLHYKKDILFPLLHSLDMRIKF